MLTGALIGAGLALLAERILACRNTLEWRWRCTCVDCWNRWGPR